MAFSPMMEQYFEIKKQYKDYMLFYRLGDFYEMFFEDAKIASKELELVLTGRDCGEEERAPMCGVPFHKADVYIGRLVEKGYRVAICEQTEDPALAKGLVKREVVRVVTPGTIIENNLLSENKNNFLCSIYLDEDEIGFAVADISTGQVNATRLDAGEGGGKLLSELAAYTPSEIVINEDIGKYPNLKSYLKERIDAAMINSGEAERFDENKARTRLEQVFGSEKAQPLLSARGALCAVGGLFDYILETQMGDISYIKDLNYYSDGQYLELDINTRRNLELTETLRSKEKKGSLLYVLDRTKTAMGARLLRSWLLHPLLKVPEIQRRQSAVKALFNSFAVREEIKETLSGMLDIERLMAKVVYGAANARDLLGIAATVKNLPKLHRLIEKLPGDEFSFLAYNYDDLEDIFSLIEKSINPDSPLTLREGGIIAKGYNAEVDRLRSVRDGGDSWKNEIEAREKEATGIKTLRIGYNKVFGYYIEISNSFKDQVPERYIRKQTLVNGERFITEELKDMEATILGASDKLSALEYNLFCEVRDKIAENSDRLFAAASVIAKTDAYYSLADAAQKNNYCCPELDWSDVIEIKNGRHPVVEKFVEDSYFVPNDTRLDTKKNRMMLITGPNMAGKSTYMRQVALIALMAQTGSFVPASEARIGVVDRIFTRVGASDDLASGQSTFMLEMSEVAYILKNATSRSLIIYDEIGRGTSTYDGMSIARAVAEYTIGKKIGAKSMFATHYHELTNLEEQFEGVVNYNIAAKKRGDTITFLRKIVRGATDDSYGIEVAKLAGVPAEVVKRAKEILSETEKTAGRTESGNSGVECESEFSMLTEIAESRNSDIIEKLEAVDINTLTPIEAMNFIYELKKML